MANPTVGCCNAIVPQLLNQQNYKHWRSRVETYLLAEDLWDVIEAEPPRPDADEAEHKAWTKKNAKALHAIKISCGADMFSFISEVRTAKRAWEVLEIELKSEERERHERDTTIDTGQTRDEAGEHNYSNRYIWFFNYASNGDWDNANKCLLDAEHALRLTNSDGHTALHLAVYNGHAHIVKELVQLMTLQDLEIKSNRGNTPLGLLIRNSQVEEEHVMIEMARYMVEKNNKLLTIPVPIQSNIPVVEACSWRKWELGRYLYSVTSSQPSMPLNGPHGATLISLCLRRMKMLDIARDLLRRYPILAIDTQTKIPPMLALTNISAAFLSGTRLTCWQKLIYNSTHIKAVDLDIHDIPINIINIEEDQHKMNFICSVVRLFRTILKGLPKLLGINDIYEMKLKHCQILEILQLMSKAIKNEVLTPDQLGIIQKSMSQAIEKGHVEFVTQIVKENKNFLYMPEESIEITIFHFAVESRQEKKFSLIYGFPKEKRNQFGLAAMKGNSMLHNAGSLSPLSQFNHIQDASLKMQRELQWFKEVENIVPAEIHDYRNTSNLTARELFTENHKNLKVEAETSMKGIATSCTVVGALIITMMFAAAFTVPGGNDGETGIPVFIDEKLFLVFIVSDIISLISSTTSVIIFLGILTSRYAEDDFLKSLPTKMMIGLFTLFLAIATMMVTFSSGLIIMLHGKYSWIVLQSILVASLPVSTSFVWMQFPLLIEIFISTYGPGIFDRKVKPLC